MRIQQQLQDNPVGKYRCSVHGEQADVLTSIYNEQTNLVVWQRELSEPVLNAADHLLTSQPHFQIAMTVAPAQVFSSLSDFLGTSGRRELCESIAELVDMFCCLFDLKRAGLRLTVLDNAMCPSFHVDKVPCRLITTYHGVGTQWLPHDGVNRESLGAVGNSPSGSQPAVLRGSCPIQQLSRGDVALLKGEYWEGNENAGLVHRSPALAANESRLVLTLDFAQ